MKWIFFRHDENLVTYRETLLRNKTVGTIFIDRSGAFIPLDSNGKPFNAMKPFVDNGFDFILTYKKGYIAECDKRRIVKRGQYSDLMDTLAYKRIVEIIEYITDNLTPQMEERLLNNGLD